MADVEVPVLIVGAGPVGATASILLSQLGVANYVVDRRTGPHRAPQAHVVNPRSLEIFRAMGFDMRALRAAATPRADGAEVAFVTTLTGTELGRLPYERQGDDALILTPEPLMNLSQHRLEPLLVDRLRAEPNVALQWRHEWQGLDQDATGVTSRIRDLDGGEDYVVRSRWVLAADGAGSRVRTAVGIEPIGPDQLQTFIMIHFEANLRPLVRERPAILYWVVSPECAGTFVAHHIDHTWVFMHRYDPETEPPATFTTDVCAAIVRRAIGRDDVALTIRDVSPWTMTAQVAERFRSERVFLVGDSAHRFPPSGGLGLNTGVQDAHNLAWKLAWVERGLAAPALLDTYEAERRPVAQNNAEQSFVNAMKILEAFMALSSTDDVARMRDIIADQQDHFDMIGLQLGFSYEEGAVVADGSTPPVRANPVRDFVPTSRPGARLPHAWVERNGARQSTLDLLARDGLTLITGSRGQVWAEVAARVASPTVHCLVAGRDFSDVDGAWQRVCEIEPDGALLVRPDQHVAWRTRRAPSDPAAALAAVVGQVLRRPAGPAPIG